MGISPQERADDLDYDLRFWNYGISSGPGFNRRTKPIATYKSYLSEVFEQPKSVARYAASLHWLDRPTPRPAETPYSLLMPSHALPYSSRHVERYIPFYTAYTLVAGVKIHTVAFMPWNPCPSAKPSSWYHYRDSLYTAPQPYVAPPKPTYHIDYIGEEIKKPPLKFPLKYPTTLAAWEYPVEYEKGRIRGMDAMSPWYYHRNYDRTDDRPYMRLLQCRSLPDPYYTKAANDRIIRWQRPRSALYVW